MASLSPFLSSPQKWVEELVALKAERDKIERREDALREKLKAHMIEKSVDHVACETHVIRIERSERVIASRETILPEIYAALPRIASERLVLRERKDDVASERVAEVESFFSRKGKAKEGNA